MRIDHYAQLVRSYHDLGPDDLFVGRIPASPVQAVILTDLTGRGVRLLPSATAQIVHGSKCSQAFLLAPWMVPNTRVVARRKALLDLVGHYHRLGISVVVTKHDHQHCGHGVRKWESLDMLYNCMSLEEHHFPFVVQPFQDVVADLRVIIVGDFEEAYARVNPYGFRMNLAAGGASRPHALTDEQRMVCHHAVARAQMPYAHIDLMLTAAGKVFLSEISLNGGIQGARVTRTDLERMKREHIESLAQPLAPRNDRTDDSVGEKVTPL